MEIKIPLFRWKVFKCFLKKTLTNVAKRIKITYLEENWMKMERTLSFINTCVLIDSFCITKISARLRGSKRTERNLRSQRLHIW